MICGIDPSTTKTGFAVIFDDGTLNHTVIDHSKIKDMDIRIELMIANYIELLNRYSPTHVFAEKPWKKSNVAVSIALANLVGAIRCWCIEHNAMFNQKMPSSWRSVIGIPNGRGIKRDEEKQYAINFVRDRFNIEPQDDNDAEAILLAECGRIILKGGDK